MEAIGLLVMLEARAGKEADAEAFLKVCSVARAGRKNDLEMVRRSNSDRESSASSTPLQMRRRGIRT